MNVVDFAPLRVIEIEIGEPLACVAAQDEKTGQCYRGALCLVGLHTRSLGMIELSFNGQDMSAQECARRVWDELGENINDHLVQDGLTAVPVGPLYHE
jgi:hypothetical protein